MSDKPRAVVIDRYLNPNPTSYVVVKLNGTVDELLKMHVSALGLIVSDALDEFRTYEEADNAKQEDLPF